MNGDDFSLFIGSSSPSAVAGYASITVPAGYVDGVLPIGISFFVFQAISYTVDVYRGLCERAPTIDVAMYHARAR